MLAHSAFSEWPTFRSIFGTVKDRFFTNLERLPTWTAIGVAALAMPGLFAEIKCTALLPD